jgi:hypothetical protein
MSEYAHIQGTNKLLTTSGGLALLVRGIDTKGFSLKETSLRARCRWFRIWLL